MGMLPDQYFRADYGNDLGYGFEGFDDALSTIDYDNPPIGETFKISGQIYTLGLINKKLEFVKREEGENE